MNAVATDLKSDNPFRDDIKADRIAFFWIAGYFAASLFVDILSELTEISRSATERDPWRYTVFEVTSVVSILTLFPLLRHAATLATPGEADWKRVAAVHTMGCLAFSIIHIFMMVMLRKAVFPTAFHAVYIFTDNLLRDFVYELRKDVISYALIVFFITFWRQLVQQRREINAAREDAKRSQRLTLKCGGRSTFVNASDVVSVKSAANYVEVDAGGAFHMARATLAVIERQLADAGVRAIRVHKSWIVNADKIRKIDPTGEGDVSIEMTNGAIIPGSRRYRGRLPDL